MTVFVALLRAVNVGGSTVLPMQELQALCEGFGWRNVRTYIQSGNVVFDSPEPERTVGVALEQILAERLGRPVGVLIRTGPALRATLEANPYRDARPAQVGVLFLPDHAPAEMLVGLHIPGREQVHAIGREIFVHYPDGIGRSKLRLPPSVANGTMRNLNTVGRLAVMPGA